MLMLKKLLKHEFKATYRIFLPIWLGLALMTGLIGLFTGIVNRYQSTVLEIALSFGMIVVILCFIFVILSPYIFLTIRFYRTTATREAYLTFTVPADSKIILLAKFITTFVWTAITTLLWLFSFLYFIAGDDFRDMYEFLFSGQDFIWQMLSVGLSIACSILAIFAAISMSQLVRDHRILASFGFYMGLYTVQQIVSVIVLIPFMIREMGQVQAERRATSFGFSFNPTMSGAVSGYSSDIYIISILITLILCVVYYFIANHMLKKKLNLL